MYFNDDNAGGGGADNNEHIVFQVCLGRYLREILVLLHLTGKQTSEDVQVCFGLCTRCDMFHVRSPLVLLYSYLHFSVFCVCPVCVAGTGRCSLFGRQYFHTFDGVLYEFPGDCSYLLAGDCSHHSFTLLGESHSAQLRNKQN